MCLVSLPPDKKALPENDLIHLYLSEIRKPLSFDVTNPEHQNRLYNDFLLFAKNAERSISEKQFTELLLNTVPAENLPLFSYYKAPITNTTPHTNIDIPKLFEVIRNPKYFAEKTAKLRTIKTDAENREFKTRNFDYVTFSGIFPDGKRNSQSCIKPSGYLCIDIDHVPERLPELKTALQTDTDLDAQLIFTSPNGDGLKVVVSYDTEQISLLETFNLVESYFKQAYDIQIDKACKNIDRACFICYDNDVFINSNLL